MAPLNPPPAPSSSLLSRLAPRSSLLRGALVVMALFLVVALLTRLALTLKAWDDVAWDASLPGAFACGLWYDVLAACYAVVPWFLLACLLPATLWRAAAMRWVVAALLGLYAVVLIFIGVAEWFFWEEFQVRFNFIAVDYLVFTQEVMDNISSPTPCR